jgi:hypothetical protein
MDEGAMYSVIGGGSFSVPTMGNSSQAAEICLKKSHDILNKYRPPPIELLNKDSGHLVCIIVPTYNVEKYVERSLHSILHQTYPNFQVVVVDDSSTDLTRTKINKFVQSDHQLCLVHLKHNTAGGARQPTNTGLDSCLKDAEYILIAYGDDWMERDALELLLFNVRRFRFDILLLQILTYSFSKTTHQDAMVQTWTDFIKTFSIVPPLRIFVTKRHLKCGLLNLRHHMTVIILTLFQQSRPSPFSPIHCSFEIRWYHGKSCTANHSLNGLD